MRNTLEKDQKYPFNCRLCGINTTAYQKLATRTDVLEVLEPVLGFRIDVETDRREGYPINVCRKCTALVLTCDKFKKTVEEGQVKLAAIIKQRKEAKERMERMEQERQEQVRQLFFSYRVVSYFQGIFQCPCLPHNS